MMIQTAKAWMEKLHDVLLDAQCRMTGQSVTLDHGLVELAELFETIKGREANVWWVGNGGSSALCSHLAQDLLNKLRIRSLALTDASLLTCMANDNGYSQIYAWPLKILARPGDLLIAVSSSGKSDNILACARMAIQNQMQLVTLSGFDSNNPLWDIPAAISFYLPSNLYGHVEIGHEALIHSVIEIAWLKIQKEKPRDPA
jgi:D-sedoheptulose 7-phosphate isomerase